MALEDHKYLMYELAILVIAVLLIVAYLSPPSEEKVAEREAQVGDTVHVWYVGMFEDGQVFDTNREEVADDDVDWPKSPGYTHSDDASRYVPLNFVLGEGSLLQDFETACMGLKRGEETTFTIPPERGYGITNDDFVVTLDILQEVAVFERMTMDDFNATYGMYYDPSAGGPPVNLTVPHWEYKWNVTLIAVADDYEVTLFNNPAIGPIANGTFPWEVSVIDVQSEGENGTIKVEHFPVIGDAMKDQYAAQDPFARELPSSRSFGIVSAVDTETFTIDYNREVVGKTLRFEIEIVLVQR